MSVARLEHINITVSDPQKTADMLCALFDWKIRWEGKAIHSGYTIHVGSEDDYIGVYTQDKNDNPIGSTYETKAALNHIALVVDNLDAIEKRVLDYGFKTENHGNYDPGRRFYFRDHDGIEFEIVSYV